MNKMLNITLPILNLSDIQIAIAGIRPYRKGGIRFEVEVLKNKKIFHNYGHGGAGVSMSYGCASLMVQQMIQQNPQLSSTKIAVLGCGYMGLFTAKILSEKGFHVKLYTKKIPFISERGSCEIASEAAAGLWLPYGYDLDEEDHQQMKLHDVSSQITFDFFKDIMIEEKSKGVKKITCVYLNSDPRITLKKFIPQAIDMNYQQKPITINDGYPTQCVTLDSILIEGHIYLKELIQECRSMGVEFVDRVFENQKDVMSLNEDMVFNCLGYQAAQVFGDKNMIPMKGQIVYCKAFKDFNYYINFVNVRGENVTTYSHQAYTGIGLTKEVVNNTIPTIESSTLLINNYNEMVIEKSAKSKPNQTQLRPKL